MTEAAEVRHASRPRDRHDSSGLSLDRLGKEAALQQLLARIAAAAPAGSRALKSGC
jgi:hypothetical protein